MPHAIRVHFYYSVSTAASILPPYANREQTRVPHTQYMAYVCVCTCVEGPAEPSPVSHSTCLIPNSGFAFGFPQREVCIKCPQTCVPVPSCPFYHAPHHPNTVANLKYPVWGLQLRRVTAQKAGKGGGLSHWRRRRRLYKNVCPSVLFVCLFVYVSICLFVCPTAFCVVNLMDTTTTSTTATKSKRNRIETNRKAASGNGERGMANGSHA